MPLPSRFPRLRDPPLFRLPRGHRHLAGYGANAVLSRLLDTVIASAFRNCVATDLPGLIYCLRTATDPGTRGNVALQREVTNANASRVRLVPIRMSSRPPRRPPHVRTPSLPAAGIWPAGKLERLINHLSEQFSGIGAGRVCHRGRSLETACFNARRGSPQTGPPRPAARAPGPCAPRPAIRCTDRRRASRSRERRAPP